MNRYKTGIGILLVACMASCSSPRPEKPNVIIILADDLGWQDVGCYDIDEPCPYETPNIDKLSQMGVKFWQAYSPAPTCAPSRGAILAGKHPARLQRTHVVGGAPPMPHNEAVYNTIPPWYSGRLSVKETIIPEVLKANAYTTGHVGKWHIAIDHNAYPQPLDHGFDFSVSDRGVNSAMKPDRLSDFASTEEDDRYRIDENGYPRDPNNENALSFIEESKDEPFFLYYATWLVHAPIQTRSKRLLEKYCEKLNVPIPTDPKGLRIPGQNNPYYAAMVEMFDYYVGLIISYLESTDDPRWKGHKLIENTYIIFTSDNGGMEGSPREIFTDNYPLDKGKINAKEGGIRVPLIITGPGIKPRQESNAMVNGIDFFPTIISWTGSKHPNEKEMDGIDLSELLTSDPNNGNLLAGPDGKVRDEMMHHFPNSAAMHSTLRIGDYKLIHNFNPDKSLELYRLYENGENRVDIEEMDDLSKKLPEKAEEMDRILYERLNGMQASFPFLNPYCKSDIPHKETVCSVMDHGKTGKEVWVKYKEQGNIVKSAYLLYTLNGGEKSEEWYRNDAMVEQDNVVRAVLPEGCTHYLFNLVDEYNFMVSYPHMGGKNDYKGGKYSVKALEAK
ncbi:MAG: sulfatase [Bacteroidetes bacterium]|nr:sulfatase [Bacteroidota bacterium]